MNILKVALWLARGLFFARVETRGMGLGYWYINWIDLVLGLIK